MKAKVTEAFKGCKDGDTQPRAFPVGALIEGDLAVAMVNAGMAKSLGAAPENKMLEGAREKKAGGPDGVKSSSPRRGRPKKQKT